MFIRFLILVFFILSSSCYSSGENNEFLKIEQLREFNQGRTNYISELRFNSHEPSKSLVLLKADSQPILMNLDGEVISRENVMSLSNFSNGLLEKAVIEQIKKNHGKPRFNFLNLDEDTQDEPVFDTNGLEVCTTTLKGRENLLLSNNLDNFAPQAKIHIFSKNDIFLFARVDRILKLIKYSPNGQVQWKKVLVPEVVDSQRFIYPSDDMKLAVSPHGDIAVIVDVFPHERLAFKTWHQLNLNLQEDPELGATVLLIINSEGFILGARSLERRVVQLAWADEKTLMLVSSHRSEQTHHDKATLSIMTKQNEEVVLPLPIDSKQFLINSLMPLSKNRVMIGGYVDFEQVPTGSIIEYGKAFVGIYDMKQKSFTLTKRFGSQRNNYVTAIESIGNGQFLMATVEDAPKTHDSKEEQYSKAVLYQITIQ